MIMVVQSFSSGVLSVKNNADENQRNVKHEGEQNLYCFSLIDYKYSMLEREMVKYLRGYVSHSTIS